MDRLAFFEKNEDYLTISKNFIKFQNSKKKIKKFKSSKISKYFNISNFQNISIFSKFSKISGHWKRESIAS